MSIARTVCAVAVCAIVLAPATVSASTIYRECFGNPDAGPAAYRDPADYGWQCHYGGFGRAADPYTGTETPVPDYRHSVTNELGWPQDLANVAAGASDSDAYGFWAFESTWPTWASRLLVWTDEFTIDRDLWNEGVIRWYEAVDNDASAPAETRVALRIAGDWFVSTQAFTTPDLGPDAGPRDDFNVAAMRRSLAFSTAADAWRPLAFTPDTALQLTLETQLAAELPAGDITAFGLYVNTNVARYVAVDTFTVTAPEPATMALVGVGIGLLMVAHRK